MADTKTSDESAATTPTGAELVRVVQGGSSKKTTAAILGHQFRGARARLSADDTAQNITTESAVSFDLADFDTDSLWSAGAPTKLTVPANVSYVDVVGQAYITSSTADTAVVVHVRHYNSANTLLKFFGTRWAEGGNVARMFQAVSGPVAVSSGDYFQLWVREETDASVTIEGDDAGQTFLALTVLGMTA